ncbi:MAG: TonB-dependent receptor plug domain-containing protein [Candidatus Latescibacterota bacterium]
MRLVACGLALCLAGLGTILLAAPGGAQEDVEDLSLDALLSTQISTAAKYAQTAGEAPASVWVVTAEDIQRFGYRTMADVLQGLCGFYGSYDRNYEYLGARGFGRPTDYNNRILLLVHGHSLNENFYGSAPIGSHLALDLDAVERVEVVRGPGSVLCGTGAMFAVVNIVTRKGRHADGARLWAERASLGSTRLTAAYGRELGNGVDLVASALWGDVEGGDVHFAEFDDPATNGGVAQDMDWDRYQGATVRLLHWGTSLQAFYSAREKGIPTGAWETVFNAPGTRSLDRYAFVEASLDRRVGTGRGLLLRAYLSHYRYEGTYFYAAMGRRWWWTSGTRGAASR